MNDTSEITFDAALARIAGRAQAFDMSGHWPAEDLDDLAACGAMRWAVPVVHGGDSVAALELHLRYEQLATASLATALTLTQRDSAVGLIDEAAPAARWLDDCATHGKFTTVGIAQLTTSRQGGRPAVAATATDSGYVVSGLIPWCTGAAHADFIVAGAALPDGQQVLLAINPKSPGVTTAPPMPLVALRSTHTTEVTLDDVHVDRDRVLRGPASGVLGSRHTGLPLGQAYLAMGLCRSALNLIATHTSDRARVVHARFDQQLTEIRDEVISLSRPGVDASASNARLRAACNSLASRITQAGIALFKGSSLLATHPAQRLAREAMFLLVWSCPNPVIECTVDLFSDG